jgi:peptide/nickel transport system permease protein
MAGFLARRMLNYLALCLLATFLAYALASLTFRPLDSLAQRQPPPPAATIEAKRVELKLDQPIPIRFVSWAGGVLHGDFGRTVTGNPVNSELWRRVGISLRLFLGGTLIGVVLGVLVGVTAAIKQYKIFDHASTLVSFLILATRCS